MNNQEKIEKLQILRDLILKKTYRIKNIGIEGRKELKKRVIEKLGISEEEYILDSNLTDYLKSINRDANFLDNLPLVLKKTIEIYCGENFRDINNGFLRKNKGLKRKTGEICSHIVDYTTFSTANFYKEGIVDALDTIISKTKLEKGIILYRGCDIKQFSDLNLNSSEELLFSIGDKIVEHGYTSTTSNLEGRFVEESNIVMIIKVPPGTHIANFLGSNLSLGEGEILIERDVEYIINDVEIVDGKIFVYTDLKVRTLNKGVENLDDIKLTDNDENLSLDKCDTEDYDIDLEFMDLEMEDIISSIRGSR